MPLIVFQYLWILQIRTYTVYLYITKYLQLEERWDETLEIKDQLALLLSTYYYHTRVVWILYCVPDSVIFHVWMSFTMEVLIATYMFLMPAIFQVSAKKIKTMKIKYSVSILVDFILYNILPYFT